MTTTPHLHPDVVGYVLGVLDPADTDAFEDHLTTCQTCAREANILGDTVLRLHALAAPTAQGLATAAVGVGNVPHPRAVAEGRVEPPAAVVPSEDLLSRPLQAVDRVRRKAGHRRLVWALAAAGAIIAGPLATLAATTDHTAPTVTAAASAPALASQLHTVQDTASGVTATAAVQDKSWGSAITVRLSGVTGPERCRLMAVDKDGTARPIGDWSVPTSGYGTPQHPEPLTINASTDLTPDRLDRLEIRTSAGRTLVAIPV